MMMRWWDEYDDCCSVRSLFFSSSSTNNRQPYFCPVALIQESPYALIIIQQTTRINSIITTNILMPISTITEWIANIPTSESYKSSFTPKHQVSWQSKTILSCNSLNKNSYENWMNMNWLSLLLLNNKRNKLYHCESTTVRYPNMLFELYQIR